MPRANRFRETWANAGKFAQNPIADQVDLRDCVFLGGLYHAERSIADRLRILIRGAMPWKSRISVAKRDCTSWRPSSKPRLLKSVPRSSPIARRSWGGTE